METYLSLGLFAFAGALLFLYRRHIQKRGRAHFSRVDKQGESVLLSREMMEMFYWGIQPIGRFLVRLGVHPDHVSWLSLITGGLSAAALAMGSFGTGAALATASALCDTLDGLVARERGIQSDAGEVLDAAIDRYVEFAFIAGLIIYYRNYAPLVLLALTTLLGSFMVSYSTAKSEAMHIELPKGGIRRPERAVYLILGAALSPLSFGFLEAGAEFKVGYPMVAALLIVGVLSNWSALVRLRWIAKALEQQASSSSASEPVEDSQVRLTHASESKTHS